MKRYVVAFATLLVVPLVVDPIRHTCAAQSTKARSALGGFNLFSVAQDVQIGQQSAVAAERQMALLGVPSANQYVNQIVQKLRPFAPGAKYPYAAKIVNAPDINAFSLPGGPLYLNRGLIEATRSEAELTSVIAHEMAHVALRHGTTSVSNAYLGKTGLGLLGGLVGKRGTTTANIVSVVGGMGLNATFLKFSRDDENDADRVGAEMMARAGYSPLAMADFFAVLRQESGRDPSKLEMFFGSHPPAVEREARVRELSGTLAMGQSSDIGGHSQLRTMMAAKTLANTRSGIWPAPVTTPNPPVSAPITPSVPIRVTIAAPSSRFTLYRQPTGFFTVSFPDNWRAIQAPGAFAATITPPAGLVTLANGQQAIAYGVVINHYYPFDGESTRWDASMSANYAPFERTVPPRGALEDATDDLIRSILRANGYLKAVPGSAKAESINGATGYSAMLSGISPLTGEEEKVKVFTRMLRDDHVLYALCVAPARDFTALEGTFGRLMQTLIVDEDAVHGVVAGRR